MATEIFAEDIEAALERLEGVRSARVVASEAGQVERIYLTSVGDQDDARLRRAVSAALMSAFSLAVDGWRIHIARLRPGPEAPAGQWRLARLEEILDAAGARVTLELRSERGGPLVGRAQGPPDAAARRRLAAQAVLDALRPVLEEEGLRPTLDAITRLPLGAGEAVVVAVSLASARESSVQVGAAVVADSETEAVIAATLEAAGKRAAGLEPRRWGMSDRWEQLEAMRAQFRRRQLPQRDFQRLRPRPEPEAPPPEAPAEAQEDSVPVVPIRPERPGGAAVGAAEQARPAVKGAMEDEFYRALIIARTRVHIRCRDGYEIPEARLVEFGTFSLLVETPQGRELVFKHGIISIKPLGSEEGATGAEAEPQQNA